MNAKILVSFVLMIAVAGCTTLYNPATGRKEFVLSTEMETLVGRMAQTQMGLTSLRVGKVTDEQFERVQHIGKQIAEVSDRKDLEYKFGVIEQPSLNAFAMPGGAIYVHTGLLDKATDEELTAVLAHEVGHVAARHAAKHLQADLGYNVLINVAVRAAGVDPQTAKVATSFYGLLSNGFSRRDELEADRLALRYTQKVGSNPRGLISFFQKMLEEQPETSQDKALVWQRTHPLTTDRIQQAEAMLKAPST